MARIPDAFIDDLLARTDIVEVIGSRVPLKRQGKEYSARCPFHDERSPSFTVSPTKQFYHCFGCGAHGTAISLPDELRPPRVPRRGRGTGQARRHGSAARHPACATRTATAATCTRRWKRRRSSSRSSSRDSDKARAYLDRRGVDAENRRALRHRLCARWLRRAEATRWAPTSAGMQLLEQDRHVLEERQRPRLRQVPRPRDVPDPRPPRPRDRLRWPRAGQGRRRRNTSTRRRPRCSTRAASCTACGRCSRRTRRSRG